MPTVWRAAERPVRRLGVLAAGHCRVEIWGLNQLARELQAAFPALEARVLT